MKVLICLSFASKSRPRISLFMYLGQLQMNTAHLYLMNICACKSIFDRGYLHFKSLNNKPYLLIVLLKDILYAKIRGVA